MSPKLKSISEQVVVVTGASSGIGLATALEPAKRGAKVVLAARSDRTLRQVASTIVDDGGHAVVAIADVARKEDVARIAEVAIAEFGRIDTWVNNAAVSAYGRLEQVSDGDARRIFDVNFWGTVHGCTVALPFLRRQGGALINVGSEVSEAAAPLQGIYTASKHAVKGYTDTLRIELLEAKEESVSVTLIQPTAVDTPFPEHARNYMAEEPQLPSPQIDPEDVAAAILKAAEHPQRDVKVGGTAVFKTTLSKVAPSLADKLGTKMVDQQKADEPARDPEGTLYKAGESGRTRGSVARAERA
ncbi:MAG: short-chain dehydrogenase/reductase [Polyangiaceae bacterium]|jgi:short-subunit dehydrogenase|nr:short-chain dehydrogenase/reductase [Polyangiaceae bacterium]